MVQRPDRKDLLAYLSGETATTPSIDKSAPIELPISASQLVCHLKVLSLIIEYLLQCRQKTELSGGGSSSSTILGHGSTSNDSDPTPNKIPRLDADMEKMRKQFAARLDAPKIKKPLPPTSLSSASDSTNTASLRDALSNDQIAALKAMLPQSVR